MARKSWTPGHESVLIIVLNDSQIFMDPWPWIGADRRVEWQANIHGPPRLESCWSLWSLYPPPTSWGGVYWNHPVCLSVRPSVCLSVRASVRFFPEFFSAIFQWIFLKLCILICHHTALCTCNFGNDHLSDKKVTAFFLNMRFYLMDLALTSDIWILHLNDCALHTG